jgi:C4-type Zn-finger protein
MTKECPMCGEAMQRKDREQVVRIPATRETVRRQVSEWICRECDYFEEVDEED